MNIFALDHVPRIAAQQHLDRHVVKMVIEYAQLLSTAHRVLDGKLVTFDYQEPIYREEILADSSVRATQIGTKDRVKKFLKLPGEDPRLHFRTELFLDEIASPFKNVVELIVGNRKCYNSSHVNHPSAIWARETTENYNWLFQLFQETAAEYTHRYGRIHKTYSDIGNFLSRIPYNLPQGRRTPFPQAMPEEFKHEDSIVAYQNYYLGPKAAIARWTNRETPTWFKDRYKDYDATHFERTTTVA
jgi:hypothetical protein